MNDDGWEKHLDTSHRETSSHIQTVQVLRGTRHPGRSEAHLYPRIIL